MRDQFSVIFVFLIIALASCSAAAKQSKKTIGSTVSLFMASITPPIIGNLIIIRSGTVVPATIGYYIYFLGMDFMIWSLLKFAVEYCGYKWSTNAGRVIMEILLAVDILQYGFDPFLHQAFTTEPVPVDGFNYYRLVPRLGQAYHRAVVYGVLAVVIIMLVIKTVRSSRIYSERYSVILGTLILAAVWQTFYIFSRTPVDRSMIGFGIFGLLIFYFSLYYRPMRLLDRMLANIASEMPEALFLFDSGGKCIWGNEPAKELTGIDENTFDKMDTILGGKFGDCLGKPDNWFSGFVLGEDDEAQYFVIENHHVNDDKGRFAGSFLTVRDNTGEQRKLRREMYNATHDRLTGLHTREYLYQRISELVQNSPDVRRYIVVLNIRNFKVVNDIFTNEFGDKVLIYLAERIRATLSDNSLYGRIAGDIFAACVPVDEFDMDEMERRFSDYTVGDGSVEYNILVHLGVYEITEQNIDVSVMIDRASLALSTIKDDYHKHVAVYDEALRRNMLWGQHISNQLTDALTDGQIRPYLQAIVDKSGRIVGAEALARWIHPSEGFLSPGLFIPVFEKNGMIVEVDRFMWKSACEILSRWQKEGVDLFISVNISPKDFYFMDVAAEIRGLVKEYGVDPSRLRVEITETVMMTDIESKMKILDELREAGFIVEMDDFGSGYSSLNMLKDMPVDVLKIDMKFLSRTEDTVRAQTIVRNIINLSDDLGISALTEGVETESQYKVLSGMGCRMFQGYYFSKPIPVGDFEELTRSGITPA
ncbi:MAG: EAL domain-containing protein [Ruminococcus sp.]|nr:EAL domain-containing protein [Ruminococcus sp.]